MTVINKQSCPTCGRSINEREIALYTGMVKALIRIFYWCQQNNRHEFDRKDIKHLFRGVDNEIARWGDWVFFGGLVYKPEGKGSWGLNIGRCRAFINGSIQIPTKAYKNPITNEIRKDDMRYISEVKNLKEFMDENMQYVAKYL